MSERSPRLPPGIHPLWFWNRRMDATTIHRQVAALHEQGCAGAVISARQGYPDAYLDEDWCQRVALAAGALRAAGMSALVADEFPYPSGQAGGQAVLGHPERWATQLIQEQRTVAGGAVNWTLPAGALLACRAWPVGADDRVAWQAERDLLSDCGMAFATDTYLETDRDLSAYNGRRYFVCDPQPRLTTTLPTGRWLVIASVQAVVDWHKYTGHGIDTLDAAAMAAFISATHQRYEAAYGRPVGAVLDGLFVDEIGPAGWSRHLPAQWREREGGDLLDLLPALCRDDFPEATAIRARLAALRRQLFAEAFLQPVQAWCAEQDVLLIEERPLTRLADARAVDIPGCDPGHVRAGVERHDLLGGALRRNAKAAASAAFWYDKTGSMCETGHSCGWGATIEDLRLLCDNLLLLGITHIMPHAAFASTAGLRKHDAPPSWFIQQSWWPYSHVLTRRVDSVLEGWQDSRPLVDVLLIDNSAHQPTRSDEAASADIQHRLLASQHDFLLVDTDVLATGRCADGRWLGHGLSVHTVIVPPCRAPGVDLRQAIDALRTGGVRVIVVGVDDDSWIDQAAPSAWPVSGPEAPLLHRCRRRLPGGAVEALLVNNGRQPVRVALPPDLTAVALPGDLPPTCADGSVQLEPYQSVLVHAGIALPTPAEARADWPTSWSVTAAGANLLRLGSWTLHVTGVDEDAAVTPITVPVRHFPLQEQLRRGGSGVPARLDPGFGTAPRCSLPRLHCCYACTIRVGIETVLSLLVEDGALPDGGWTLAVDGTVVLRDGDLAPVDGRLDDCRGAALPALSIGSHCLELSLITDQPAAGLANPLYLAGDFAVDETDDIVAPRSSAPLGDICAAGLPYYAGAKFHGQYGTVQYKLEI